MDLINIVFRFFDFFLILGIAVYLIQHSVIPTVEKMLREYGILIYNLESDCKNLQLQTQSIYENIQDQDRQFQLLQAKFVIWQQKCQERVRLQEQEQQQIDIFMQQRFETRTYVIKNDVCMKEQLPGILDATTKNLQNKYHGVDVQKQYIDTLIHVMKEPS